MTTALQLWMLAGMIAMGGVACLVWWLSPAQPDLGDVVARLAPSGSRTAAGSRPAGDLTDRVGWWTIRRLPTERIRVPEADLAILGLSRATFYGQKVLNVAIATAAAPVLSWLASTALHIPLAVPVVVTAAAAVGVWFCPMRRSRRRPRRLGSSSLEPLAPSSTSWRWSAMQAGRAHDSRSRVQREWGRAGSSGGLRMSLPALGSLASLPGMASAFWLRI